MKILRSLLNLDTISSYSEIIEQWRVIAARQQAELSATRLIATRSLLNLAVAWRVSIERPEEDVRDNLDAMIRELSDQVAVLEEHAPL